MNNTQWHCAALSSTVFSRVRLDATTVECEAADDRSCRLIESMDQCERITTTPTKGLSCNPLEFDTPSSWCSRLLNTWLPADPRVYSCRRWTSHVFVGSRVNDGGDVECYSTDGATCAALGSQDACASALGASTGPGTPVVCSHVANAVASYASPDSWCASVITTRHASMTSDEPSNASNANAATTTTPPLQLFPSPELATITTPTTTPSSSPTFSKTGGVALAVALAACVLVVLFVAFMRRRRRHATAVMARKRSRRTTVAIPAGVNLGTIEAYHLDVDTLVLTKRLVVGANQDIYLGMFHDRVVIVKQLTTPDIDLLERLIQKTTLQASLQCPYVVDCLGACWDDNPFEMQCVLEYMDCGDLRSYLAVYDSHNFHWSHKVACLLRLVEGLAHLHAMPRAHGALQSKNVLIDSTKGTKLTNFGLSSAALIKSFPWVAPELLEASSRGASTAADIYALGVIMSELDTHAVPYADMRNTMTGKVLADVSVRCLVQQGRATPNFSDSIPSWLHEIALACLAHDPIKRPSAVQVLAAVQRGAFQKPSKMGFLV
ncbi:Aste57867_16426 [Aphanomyces stellatus]|uniref:Aste57867_16426 protein n=1 Tax=Aphanomyces stellatus TaxID=120398 RepID=A0A485L686_9STRA|nr:hypothetical protein As57867_016369 [Aphanomyces stellatus]VFT93201.1 Aste57867_16426 [Aphanomyces stellatus]